MIKFFYSDENNRITLGNGFTPQCWVDMIAPTDDEIETVVEQSGIPDDMIRAALDEEERARYEYDDGCTMYIVDCPIIEASENGDSYSTLPLAMIYNQNCIVTVSLKGNPVLKDFITGREKVFPAQPIHFILRFMLGNAKRFLYSLKQIDRRSMRVKSELEKDLKNEDLLHLLDLENSLVYFSTSLNANSNVHEKLSKLKAVTANEDYQDLFDDVIIETRQAIETCNVYKDILKVTMDAYGSMISNNANDAMKKLTLITIIIAIPTMIAGFWGMNMPVPFEQTTGTLWFWLVVAGTFALTVLLAFIMVKVINNFGVKNKRAKQKKNRERK